MRNFLISYYHTSIVMVPAKAELHNPDKIMVPSPQLQAGQGEITLHSTNFPSKLFIREQIEIQSGNKIKNLVIGNIIELSSADYEAYIYEELEM